MNGLPKALTVSAGLALALALGACDGDSGGCSSNPTAPECRPTQTPPPPPVRNVISTGTCQDVGVDVLCFFPPFTTSQRGDLDVTADWTFPEDVIQILISNGTCTLDQINASQCSMLSSSTTSNTPKPRILTVRGVAAGTYQVYVGNRGPRTESISMQVGLTTGGATSNSAGHASATREPVEPYLSRALGH
jgi:hypothetical protein